MKAFVGAICTLIFMIGLTIFNGVYINNVTSSLINEARTLKISDTSVEDFSKKWEEKQFFIRIASSHKETHRIDEVLGILSAKAKNDAINGFEEEKALLIEYLTQIKEDETVSFDSII